jgi:hypothetical protein
MKLAGTSLTVLLIAATPGVVQRSDAPTAIEPTPGCELPVWGNTVTLFERGLNAYVTLRQQIEGQARVVVARSLAGRIRAARPGARQGDLFTAALSVEIKRSLRRALDADTLQVIMDDNPGEIPSQVNDDYREGAPLSTMPPNILAALPRLPQGVEYRFVERHLVLA